MKEFIGGFIIVLLVVVFIATLGGNATEKKPNPVVEKQVEKSDIRLKTPTVWDNMYFVSEWEYVGNIMVRNAVIFNRKCLVFSSTNLAIVCENDPKR